MSNTFKNTLIQSIREAAVYDSGSLQAPIVILWPDPERQWEAIIDKLQQEMPELLRFGGYDLSKRQGPAIWLKCMVGRTLPEADWDTKRVPVIYLPGIAKGDLRNLSQADPQIAPLMEYQYTGALWLHRNGKEWTVNAFLQNSDEGLGLDVGTDHATKDAGIKALPALFEDQKLTYPSFVDADFLYQLLFKNEEQSILEWMCQGDEYLKEMPADKQHVFNSICQKKYGFVPVEKNVVSIAEMLGMKKSNEWEKIWDHYCLTPQRYPKIEELLEKAKPESGGEGLFAIPEDTWPQINREAEEQLMQAFHDMTGLNFNQASSKIKELEKEHAKRRSWVWAQQGKANLALALNYLNKLCSLIELNYDATSLEAITAYYKETGYQIDHKAIQALQVCRSGKEKMAVKEVLRVVYNPWLERLTRKFQERIAENPQVFTKIDVSQEKSECILFVDAFRYDLAKHWSEQMKKQNVKLTFDSTWAPLPSLTPTCKPFFSPMAMAISKESRCKEFRPQTNDEKDLTTSRFEKEMSELGYSFVRNVSDLNPEKKTWMEIGKIDQHGHQEQLGLVDRIEELCALIEERIQDMFSAGFRKIRIVTDHGWLLVPGGMQKEELPKDHIETRWGRCALLKEGVPSELLHLPWMWNKSTMIAFAPATSFFKANNEYAHGGISLQECLVPVIDIEKEGKSHKPVSIDVKWTGLRCAITVSGAQSGYHVEIRTKHTDEDTAITKTKPLGDKMKASLVVENEDHQDTAAFVVVTDEKGIVLEKRQTIVGE